MENEHFVAKRHRNIVYMLLGTFAGTIVMYLLHGRAVDELAVGLVLDVIFLFLLWFLLEHNRNAGLLFANRETTFKKIRTTYLLCWVFVAAVSFLPEYEKPMLAVSLLMTVCATPDIAVSTGVFLSGILSLALGSSMQELALYLFFSLFGGMIADALKSSTGKRWGEMIVAAVSVILPALFYYLFYREIRLSLLLVGAAEGLVLAGLVHLFYQRAVIRAAEEIADMLEELLDDSYVLRRELKNFSMAYYQHALRVSKLSGKCAAAVGADEKLCAAAGFYYRIGILEGDSIAASGVKIGRRKCFPEELLRIISEYDAQTAPPSSVSSAIVHMVDGLVKKLEVLDADMMLSDWNQNMVIYQTLNDFSAQGVYDKSGLSMNMFLKIREYLVNEGTTVMQEDLCGNRE